ncbi:MAG: hypothetical protein CFE24_13300 [Flavobacterium sp. BFFFF2]|nr:MAG: hypothetical protein CFE24_13300 [Flavobacterium sp. BFFFF2]
MKFDFTDNEQIKKPGFEAPDGFFDSFPDQMMTRWEQQHRTVKGSRIILWNRWMAAAAVIVLALSLPLLNHFFTGEKNIAATAISHYVQTQTEVTDEEVASLLDNEQLQQLQNEYSEQHELITEESLLNVHADDLMLD